MSKSITLRFRSSKGTFILKDVSPDTTFLSLKQLIEKQSSIPAEQQKLKFSYPPKYISGSDETKLSDLGIKHGETFIIETEQQQKNSSQKKVIDHSQYSNIPPKPADVTTLTSDGVAVKRVMESDNSCLFNAVAYCLEGAVSRKKNRAPNLRRVVADFISSDPILYNQAYLGQKNSDYVKWILDSKSWGGAIELSILSKVYGIQICAFDVKSMRKDVYGEGNDYKSQIFLIYDGIHYDAMALSPIENAPEDCDITVFSTKDTYMLSKATELIRQANLRHEYTDVSDFKLRCMICAAQLKGEKEATEHAKKTGHTNFAENK